MKADTQAARIPDVVLERYAVGEVSAAERAEIDRQLHHDASVRARLDAIRRSDHEMQESGLAAAIADRVRRAAESQRPGAAHRPPTATLLGRWALPAAVGAAVILAVVIGSRAPDVGSEGDGDRIKGMPSLTIFRQTPAGSETLADGALTRPGDLVRVAYQAAGRPYGAIVSIDGRGTVTPHLPATVGPAVRLRPGDRILLDQAYELDDAPGWEQFYFVTSRSPFDATQVIEAARHEAARRPASPTARLDLPGGLEQSTFTLQKEHRP